MSKSDLLMAMSVKRKKKMAQGGPVSASAEQRPMPSTKGNDAPSVAKNGGKKPLVMSGVLDNPPIPRPKTQPIKHPRHIPINGASLRLRDQEDDLISSSSVNNGPQEEPPSRDDEEGADRQGPMTSSLRMKRMAEGGEIEKKQEPLPMQEQEQPEEKREHSVEMIEIPVEDAELHDSIAAAIMSKRKKYAEGGEVNGADSIYSDDSDQADIARNAEEDANMEDQLSYDALRKENYSESEGLAQLDSPDDSNLHGDPREEQESDKHDRVSRMRSRMALKRR